MIETKAIIYEVKEGQVTKITLPEMGSTVYDVSLPGAKKKVELKEQPAPDTEIIHKQPEREYDMTKPRSKGAPIARIGHNTIFSNVLDAMKKAVNDNMSRSEMLGVLKEFYPYAQKSSVTTFYSVYTRYVSQGGVEPVKQDVLSTEPKIKKQRKKYRRRRPKGSFARSKTYNTWVMEDEHTQVKREVFRWDTESTVDNIIEETGFKRHRVMAALDVMKDKHELYKKHQGHIIKYIPIRPE